MMRKYKQPLVSNLTKEQKLSPNLKKQAIKFIYNTLERRPDMIIKLLLMHLNL
uniref:Uncharacterized protein n=1 Tax=Rhizophora mucronata TaxID=61149 RepID=A0A2P2NMT9_RHIMU